MENTVVDTLEEPKYAKPVRHCIKVEKFDEGEENNSEKEPYLHTPATNNQAFDDFILECSIQSRYRAKINGNTVITWYQNDVPYRTQTITSNGNTEG